MSKAPVCKLNLEDLLRKWWVAKQTVHQIESAMEVMKDRLDDAATSLNLVENDIGLASECFERSMVYSIGEATVILAWQEEQNYHTIELVDLETL
jgi:hypothetical protein